MSSIKTVKSCMMALSSDVAGSALAAPEVDARPRALDPTGLCNNGFCKEKKEHEEKEKREEGRKRARMRRSERLVMGGKRKDATQRCMKSWTGKNRKKERKEGRGTDQEKNNTEA